MASNQFISRSGRKSVVAGDGQGVLISKGIRLTLDSDISYSKGDIVEHNNSLWKANSDISTLTAGVIEGTDSDQWTQLSGGASSATPAVFEFFDSATSYPAGSIVIKDNGIWIANTDTPAGTIFTSGPDSEQWSYVITSTINKVEIFSAETDRSGTDDLIGSGDGWYKIGTDSTKQLEVVVTASGTYRFNAQTYGHLSSSNSVWAGFGINGANPTVENSTNVMYTTQVREFINFERYIELEAGDVVAYYLKTDGGTLSIQNDATRYPVMTGYKLGEYSASIGYTPEFLSLKHLNSHAVSSGDNARNWEVLEYGGQLTIGGIDTDRVALTAGKTYHITASLSFNNIPSTGFAFYALKDSAGNTIGAPAIRFSGSSTATYSEKPNIDVIYTPTIDTEVMLVMPNVSAGVSISSGYSQWNIQTISGQDPVYEDYETSVWKGANNGVSTIIPSSPVVKLSNTLINYGNDISYDSATGILSLRRGRVYRIMANIGSVRAQLGQTLQGIARWGLQDVDTGDFVRGGMQITFEDNVDTVPGATMINHVIECEVDTRLRLSFYLPWTLNVSAIVLGVDDYTNSTHSFAWMSAETIASRTPRVNTSKLVDLSDVITPTSSIAKGAELRCFDGYNWEVDTYEFVSDRDVPITHLGINFFMDTVSIANKHFAMNHNYANPIVYVLRSYWTSPSTRFEESGYNVSTSPVWYSDSDAAVSNDTKNLGDIGDTVKGTMVFAESMENMYNGNYIELDFTFIVGPSWNNNRFIIKRIH